MSKSTFGLRKAGLSALAVTLTFGAGFAGAGAAYATPGDYTADTPTPKVMQGADDQAAANLNHEFANVFTTNTKFTFTVAGNNCTTQGGIDAAIEYANQPAVTVSRDLDADEDQSARIPTYTVQLGSSTTECATAGIQDEVTVTLTQPSSGDDVDSLQIDVKDIAYNLGVKAPLGDVNVDLERNGTPGGSAVNADVVNKSFMFMPLVAANPGSTGKTLGTATYGEATPGAYFESGDNTVELVVAGGTFTDEVTPNISVPTGYKVKSDATTEGTPKTDGTDTYTFIVEGPATLTAAQVTVSGLKFDAGSVEGQYDLSSSVTKPGTTPEVNTDSSKAVNVVNFGAKHRIGGSNRYETAAKLFNAGGYFDSLGATDSHVAVLSGGQKFPDALSANYLAGQFDTGTLLTKADELPAATKNALIDNDIDTVYITGGPAAVSTEIENQIESMHVGGNINSSDFINVVRLEGANRYETNKRINSWVDNKQAGTEDTVFMAAGTAPYDSLAGGPVAYADDMPLVLTGGKEMDRGEQQQLIDLGASTVVILGGEGVVSQEIENDLKADGYTVVRLQGDTRYETAAAIATWATEGYDFNGDDSVGTGIEADRGFDSATTHITNGRGFADALSAGPLAGSNGQPVLLSKGADEVGDGTADYLAGKEIGNAGGTTVDTLFALGLTGATSASMIEDAAEVLETK